MREKNIMILRSLTFHSLLLISAMTAGACTGRSGDSAQVKLIGGERASISQFPSVVYIGSVLCSAVALSEWQFATAGHCVERESGIAQIEIGQKIRIATNNGAEFNGGQQIYMATVTGVAVHPTWVEGLKKHKDATAAADDPDVKNYAFDGPDEFRSRTESDWDNETDRARRTPPRT